MQKTVAKTETLGMLIGSWIYKQTHGRGDDLLTSKEIALYIQKCRKNIEGKKQPVTYAGLNSVLCAARKYMELEYHLTLWNVRGMGWRTATARETAFYGMATTKKLLVLADRTRRLCDIVDSKYIPEAFERTFGNTQDGVKSMVSRGKSFLLMWVKKQQEVKLLTADGGKKDASNKT